MRSSFSLNIIPAAIFIAAAAFSGHALLAPAPEAPVGDPVNIDPRPLGTPLPEPDCPPDGRVYVATGDAGAAPETAPCPTVLVITGMEPPPCNDGVVTPGSASKTDARSVGLPVKHLATPGPLDNPAGVQGTQNAGRGPEPGQLDSPFVHAATGDLTWQENDLYLPGIGLDFRITRTYRSLIHEYDGAYGRGWQLNIHRRIEAEYDTNGDLEDFIFVTGSGIPTEGYTASGAWWSNGTKGETFEYETISNVEYLIRHDASGLQETFERLDTNEDWFYLVSAEDMHGNEVTYDYTDTIANSPTTWVLETVTDTVGRSIEFEYVSATLEEQGRLKSITVYGQDVSATQLGKIEYEYTVDSALGSVPLLDKVTGLTVATEHPVTSALDLKRQVRKYVYQNNSGNILLKEFINGNNQTQHQWLFSGLQVTHQRDRVGASSRGGESLHVYTYGATENEYQGPDMEKRVFVHSNGRIDKVREYLDTTTYLETAFTYDSGCSCRRVTMITYPDGRQEEFIYDADGNVQTYWLHPPTSSSSPSRVERWDYSDFDPANGKLKIRLLQHELRRDAAPNEQENGCDHPDCGKTTNPSGYQVHNYTWSLDEKNLLTIDYGSVQADVASGTVHRKDSFTYFTDGQLATRLEIEDGTTVATETLTRDTNDQFLIKHELEDHVASESWTTTMVRNLYGGVTSVTTPDGVVTTFALDEGQRPYSIVEASGTSDARTTTLRYDGAGRLVSEKISSGSLSETTAWDLDEVGFPETISVTGPGGSAKTTTFTYSKSGFLEKVKDWRGYELETKWDAMGALRLPSERIEHWGTASNTIWEAGDGGSFDGYDDMGRLEAWRNAEGWKGYIDYDDYGRLKQRMVEVDSGYYRGAIYNYDARGYLKEVETGAVQGTPMNPTSQQLFEHHVLVHNTHGHLVNHAVYEDAAATVEVRMLRYKVDGRGRPIESLRWMGDTGVTTHHGQQ